MKMISMKNDAKEEKKDYATVCAPCDDSEYPYCLKLYLNEETIGKLGIKNMPEVGTYLTLNAAVEVVGVSMREVKDGKTDRCIDLQITDMALEPYEEKKSATKTLYGS